MLGMEVNPTCAATLAADIHSGPQQVLVCLFHRCCPCCVAFCDRYPRPAYNSATACICFLSAAVMAVGPGDVLLSTLLEHWATGNGELLPIFA